MEQRSLNNELDYKDLSKIYLISLMNKRDNDEYSRALLYLLKCYGDDKDE